MATDRQGYGREIARELSGVWPGNWRWAGRYVWWMQVLAGLVCAVVLVTVWQLAGGDWAALHRDGGQLRPAVAAAVALGGLVLVAALAEAEARVTTRRAERRRFAARFGIDPMGPAPTVPDGYVLAYELGSNAGQLGAQFADPVLTVAAVRADRWDLTEPLWRFTLRDSAIAGGGVIVQLPAGSFAAVDQVRWLWAELDAGRLRNLVAVEMCLAGRFARDVSAVRFQPPAG